MPLICLETFISASPSVVFDISRSVDLHKISMLHHKEEIVAGIKKGLMNKGDTVTWRATHFFKSRILKVMITQFNRPHFFKDEMIEGDFTCMQHEHFFNPSGSGTIMVDQFYFESPFGILGRLVNRLVLENYMKQLLIERNTVIKAAAESADWKQFISFEPVIYTTNGEK